MARIAAPFLLILLVMLFVTGVCARAGERPRKHGPIELRSLSIEYGSYFAGSRVPMMPENTPNEQLAVNVELTTLWGWVVWRNRVHASTDFGQYRLVGLRSFFGFLIPAWDPWLEVGHLHHSQHLLEDSHPLMKFASEDSVWVRVYIVY